jgi:hypothetical protein
MTSVFALIILLAGVGSTAQAQPAEPSPDEAETAFHEAVARYVDLQKRLKNEVPTLRVAMEAAEISRASDILATSVQRSRRNARPGDIFNADVTKLITQRVRAELEGVNIKRFLAAITDEPTLSDRPNIHKRYPAASSMATTPTRVLAVLPAIPEALEYRFVGRALVLRDRDAAMIIDYIADVLPAK